MSNTTDWSTVFEELTPPPGGLQKLRTRLDEVARQELRARRPMQRTRWAFALAAVACLLTLVAVQVWQPGSRAAANWSELIPADGNPALTRLGLTEPPLAAVSVPPQQSHRIALQHVEVNTPGVLYYRFAVLPGS